MPCRILILGGTSEGRLLAETLGSAGYRVISSLAGRVGSPRLPVGEVRSGGFGGIDGMAEYLASQQISAVVDATHPFAAGITANAVAACERTGTPLLVLHRPAWEPVAGDRWTAVPDLAAAAAAVARRDPEDAVLLTVGRQGVAAFADAPQRFWLRAVEPPDGPLPARVEVLLDRGPFRPAGERELLRRLHIDVLVTKNSGGDMTAAKLTAARELQLPVIMVERPPLPSSALVTSDPNSVLTWAKAVT